MATVESLKKSLDALDGGRAYFSIEDLVSARPMAGESFTEALHREHPLKTYNPTMVRFLSEDRSE